MPEKHFLPLGQIRKTLEVVQNIFRFLGHNLAQSGTLQFTTRGRDYVCTNMWHPKNFSIGRVCFWHHSREVTFLICIFVFIYFFLSFICVTLAAHMNDVDLVTFSIQVYLSNSHTQVLLRLFIYVSNKQKIIEKKKELLSMTRVRKMFSMQIML